jgi:hypothetical protein
MEDASFFRFAAMPVAVKTALGAEVAPGVFPVEFSVALMCGVVAQIQSQENMCSQTPV